MSFGSDILKKCRNLRTVLPGLARECNRSIPGAKLFTRGRVLSVALITVLPLSVALATLSPSQTPEKAAAAHAAVQAPKAVSLFVNPAETAASLFARLGISDPALEKFVYSDSGAVAFAHPRRGELVTAEVTSDGTPLSVSIYLRGKTGANQKITLRAENGSYSLQSDSFAIDRNQSMAAVRVKGSFASSAKALGIPSEVIESAKRVSYRNQKLLDGVKAGSTVSLIYESLSAAGHNLGSDRLLGISLTSGGKSTSLYWFPDGTRNGGYYFADGSTPEQTFRRYPMDSYRITSPFSLGRYHPVLGRTRPHLGMDLAAPRGTPVYAVSDGVILAADRRLSGYGNHIDINHGNGLMSRYAHLDRYASGIRAGVRVAKGQLIGYCGSTGISTGNHVHYEMHLNGQSVNPATVKIATDSRLAQKYYTAGKSQVTALAAGFKTLDGMQTAANGASVPVTPLNKADGTALASADVSSKLN